MLSYDLNHLPHTLSTIYENWGIPISNDGFRPRDIVYLTEKLQYISGSHTAFSKQSPCLSKWLVPWLRKVIGNSSKGFGELVVPFVLAGG